VSIYSVINIFFIQEHIGGKHPAMIQMQMAFRTLDDCHPCKYPMLLQTRQTPLWPYAALCGDRHGPWDRAVHRLAGIGHTAAIRRGGGDRAGQRAIALETALWPLAVISTELLGDSSAENRHKKSREG
jgi:hypothetical protein